MLKGSPLLIAAEFGVMEMVEEILYAFPTAIRDEDVDKKNVVMLAVENGRKNIFNLLSEKYTTHHRSMLEKADKNGNTVIHLAATTRKVRPWNVSCAALQIQWDHKWYNVCILSLFC